MHAEQWLLAFREIGAELRRGLPAVLSLKDGRTPLGRGAAGDKTFPIDHWAEQIILSALEKLHRDGAAFTLISEELGVRKFGEGTTIVLADPIDGSNNAKNGVPFFATSLAVLDGSRLSDLQAGYVANLAVHDEFWAVRGQGAYKNGTLIRTPAGEEMTIVAYEATHPAEDLPRLLPLLTSAKRTRCFGSTALDLAYLASGAVSAFATATPSRSFDYAAGMLVLAEAGGVTTDLAGGPLDGVIAGLERTAPLLAAKNAAAHRAALAALGGK